MIAFIEITLDTGKKMMINLNQITFIQQGYQDDVVIGLGETGFALVEKYGEIHERIKNLLEPRICENHIS